MPNFVEVDLYNGPVDISTVEILTFSPIVCLEGVTYDIFFGDPNVSSSGTQVTTTTSPVKLSTLATNQSVQTVQAESEDRDLLVGYYEVQVQAVLPWISSRRRMLQSQGALPTNSYSTNPFRDRTIIEFTDPCVDDATVTASLAGPTELTDYLYTQPTPTVTFSVSEFMSF